jgi:hypothetical protein
MSIDAGSQPVPDSIVADLQRRLATVEASRQRARTAEVLRIVLLLGLAAFAFVVSIAVGFAATIAALPLLRDTEWGGAMAIVVFAVPSLGIMLAALVAGWRIYGRVAAPVIRSYQAEFDAAVAAPLLHAFVPDAPLTMPGAIDRERVERCGLFLTPDRIRGTFRIDDSVDGGRLSVGSLELSNQFRTLGNVADTTYTITFCGLVAILDAPDRALDPVIAWPRGRIPGGRGKRPDLVRERTNDPAFDEHFEMLTVDSATNVRQLTPAARAILVDGRRLADGPVLFAVGPTAVALAVASYDFSRIPLEARHMRANAPGELLHEAQLVALLRSSMQKLAALPALTEPYSGTVGAGWRVEGR